MLLVFLLLLLLSLRFACFGCFTLHHLPLGLNNKTHPVTAMERLIIIAAIIIILALQRCLSGLCAPTASWMGTERKNANQQPSFINLLVTGVGQKSLFTLLSRVDVIRSSIYPYLLPRGKRKVLSSANICTEAPQHGNTFGL